MCELLKDLYGIVVDRVERRPPGSYTASLAEKGVAYVARKVGEEAVELVVAALREGRERLVEEVADLLYHLTVLMVLSGVTYDDVFSELRKRMKR